MSRPVVLFGLTTPMSILLLGQRLELMRDAGYDVHVVTGGQEWGMSAVPVGITIHLIPMDRSITPLKDIRSLISWVKLTCSLRPFAVIGATPKSAMLSMIAARLLGVPVRIFEVWGAAWDGHHGLTPLLLKSADRLSAWCATSTIAVSPSLAKLLVKSWICRNEPVVLGAGGTKGVSLNAFSPRNRVLPLASPVLGFLGRLSRDKGIHDLLEVYSCVKESIPNVRLMLIGDFDAADIPMQSTINELRSDPSVVITGWTDHPQDYLQTVHLLIFPSSREGMPNAVLEAAACEIPSIGYNVTGTRDAIEHEATGVLVPVHDVNAMAEAAVRLLRSPSEASKLGAAARKLMEESFDSNVVCRNYLEYLQSLA